MAVGFSRGALWAGLRAALPLQAALLPFALVFGIIAQDKGLSLLEAGLMSGVVYAGSAQLLAMGIWTVPAPVLAASLAAFVINLRLALMGPVIAPWLDRLRSWRLLGTLFLLADQNWAMSVREMQAGRWDAAYVFGSGLIMWLGWVFGTVVGHAVGAGLHPPPNHPMYFAALAVFIALVAGMWRGRRDLLPWLIAAGTSLVVSRLFGGTWYIIVGALAGAAFGVWRDRRS